MDRRFMLPGTQVNRLQVRHLINLSYLVYLSFRWVYQLQQWIIQQFTPVGIGVVIMLFSTGLLGLWSLQSQSHLLFFLCLSLLTTSLISRQFITLSFQVERLVPAFGSVGEPLSYSIQLRNLTPQVQAGLKSSEALETSYLAFHEFLKVYSPRLNSVELKQRIKQALLKRQWAIAPVLDIPTLKPRGKAEITGHLTPLRRGRLALNRLTVKAADPLGLSYRQVSCQHQQSICILPKQYRLPDLFSVSHPADQRGEAVLTPTAGESLEFLSLRDYRPGDPTNTIHWKSWAKVGRPVVREQQRESSVHYGLLLDTFSDETNSDIFEEMLAIATSIVMQPQRDMALLDVCFAHQDLRCITAGCGTSQQELLLEMIATMNPCQSNRFQDLIPLAQSRFSRLSSYVCLLIQWDETRHTFLEHLAQQNIPTKAIVICAGEQSHEGLRYLSLSPNCTVHFMSINQIQQDLLAL